MKFQINECPLCGVVLKFKSSHGVTTYFCSTEMKSHYEVETDGKVCIQHIYAFPYAVDNFASSQRSRIYKWKEARWRFVKEVPRLAISRQDALLATLRTVVPPTGTPYPAAM